MEKERFEVEMFGKKKEVSPIVGFIALGVVFPLLIGTVVVIGIALLLSTTLGKGDKNVRI